MSFTAREARRKKQTQRQKNLFTYLVTILKTLLTQFCHCFLTTIHNYLQFLCSAKYYSFCFPSLKSLWQYRSWSFNLGISTTRYTTLGGFSKKLREKKNIPYFLIQFPRKLFFFEFGNCSQFKYFNFLPNKLNFCCGNYSREETIQGRKLYEEMRY